MHLAWRGCAVLLLVAAACGGDDGNTGAKPDAPTVIPDEGAHSGTRLRLQWRAYGETRSLAGMFDNDLNTACTASTWTDNTTYCTPTASRVVYTDDHCTQPIGQVSHLVGCTGVTPSYLLATDVVGCAPRPSHLYKAGAKTAAQPFFQRDSITGECLGPSTSTANADYYTVGDEVLPTTLIALSRTPATPADTGRIQRRFLTSGDGAAVFTGPHDSMLDLDCAPAVTANATSALCAPSATQAIYFHDEMCKMGEVVTRAECPKPAYASQATMPACPSSPLNYFAVGDATTAPPIYTSIACSSTTEPADSAFYLLSQSIAVATMTRTRDTTAGRTVQLIHDAEGTTAVRDPLLFDAGHMVECEEVPQSDGTTRCLPKSGNVASFFTEGCTTPIKIAQVSVGPASCAAVDVPTMVTRALPPMPPTVCGTSFEIYDVGAQYTDALYTGTPQACVVADTTGFQNYVLGTMHSVTEFPLATLTKD